jgi:histidinol-phosphate/aromatic aminotransferase/cobyric acid decarboxylase-like protein
VGEHQIHNTDSTIGYAVVGKTVLQAYNPYRMVFMLPQYRLEETGNYSTPEIEFSAKKIIIDLNRLIATPDQLIFGEGSYDALDQMLQSFGNLGYNQVIGRGSHFPYIQQLADRHFVNYQAVAPESSLDQTGASARLTKQLEIEDLPPSIIYLDVPSNPTGFVDSMDDLRQLIQVAQTKNHLVFIDSAYGDLLPQYQDLLNLPSQHDNVVTFGSFSKNRHLAGDRLGFAHLSKPLTNLVSQSGLPLSSTMTASGLARLQSLATIDQAEFLAASHTQVSERKQVLVDSLQELPGVRVASTDKAVSIIYVDLIDNEIKEALANLQTKNPALSIGRILKERYGVNNEPGEEFINTDPGLGATGFRLRIPPQIEQSQAIALRLNDLMNEIVNNPDAILISAN